MNSTALSNVIHPDFPNTIISEIEAAKQTVGCISVGEFDKDQWYQLPAQIGAVVDRLAWCRMQNDRAILAQSFHYDQARVVLLYIKSKAVRAWMVQEYGKGKFCIVDNAFNEDRLTPWSDLLVLLNDLIDGVRCLLDELEQHRQSSKAHIAAMRQTLERAK